MEKLITSGQLTGYRRLKDKSVSLHFETSEKTPHEIMKIDEMLDSFGYLVFKPESQLTNQEIDEIDSLDTDLFDKARTQSQRIRNVLYKLWEQDNNGHSDFKDFYKFKTEQIITWLKGKIQ